MDEKEARKLFVLAKTELKMPETQLKALIGPHYSKLIVDQSAAMEITGYQSQQKREELRVRGIKQADYDERMKLRGDVRKAILEQLKHGEPDHNLRYGPWMTLLAKIGGIDLSGDASYESNVGKLTAEKEMGVDGSVIEIKLKVDPGAPEKD